MQAHAVAQRLRESREGVRADDESRRLQCGRDVRMYGKAVHREHVGFASPARALLPSAAETDFDFDEEREECLGVVTQLGPLRAPETAPAPAPAPEPRQTQDPQEAMWRRFDAQLDELRRHAPSLAAPHRARESAV